MLICKEAGCVALVLLKKNNVKGKNFDEKSSSITEQLVISQESKSFVKGGFYVSCVIAS